VIALALVPQGDEVRSAELGPALALEHLTFPGAERAGLPGLARGADGRTYLWWVEHQDHDSTLWFSAWVDGAFAAPRRAASGRDWFINWTDFPQLAALADGTLIATWLANSGRHSYRVEFSLSPDGGARWSEPQRLHEHDGPGEHGFVSLVPRDAQSFLAIWLDGRAMAGSHGQGQTALLARTVSRSGELGPELVLDERVCDCCPTTLIPWQDGRFLAAYRDRSADEIRDVSFVEFDAQKALGQERIAPDDWRLPGCPVNGPRLAASPSAIALLWFTGAPHSSVWAAWAPRAGSAFDGAHTVRVDEGAPEGRVDACFLADDTLVATWLEHEEGQASWRARALVPGAAGERPRLGPPLFVAETSSDRASGLLRLLGDGDGALVACKDVRGSSVSLARLTLAPSSPPFSTPPSDDDR
jgi:hypothetical protein